MTVSIVARALHRLLLVLVSALVAVGVSSPAQAAPLLAPEPTSLVVAGSQAAYGYDAALNSSEWTFVQSSGRTAGLAPMDGSLAPSTDVLAALRPALVAAETAGTAGRTALDATPSGRVYSAHYLNDTGPGRNIPGSVVDETIDHGNIAKDLPDRTVFYDPKNDITVVESKTTGKIMSVRRGAIP